jgi:hypothetical protein
LSLIAKIDKKYSQSLDVRKKKDVILEYVKELEGKLSEDQISTHIAKTLKGYADHSYVNKVLGPKYKVAYRIDNVARRHSKTIPTKASQTKIKVAKTSESNRIKNILNPVSTPRKQQAEKEIDEINEQLLTTKDIDPKDYDIDELDRYSVELKDAIIRGQDEVLYELHNEGFYWDAKVRGYLKEIRELKDNNQAQAKEIEELRGEIIKAQRENSSDILDKVRRRFKICMMCSENKGTKKDGEYCAKCYKRIINVYDEASKESFKKMLGK